jgi:predicted small secreted protein
VKRVKKPYLILAAILVLTSGVLAGCKPSNTTNGNSNGNGNSNSNGNETVYTISDYYPFTANLKTVYEGQGNEFASKTEYVDYIKGDKIQIRSDNGGTVTATVLQNLNGELVQLNSKGEVYYKQDMTSETAAQNVVLLKEPLKTGTEWTLPDGTKRAITGVDVDVTTPSGDYKALEVTTTYTDSTTKDYYALNKGLVKSVWSSNGSEVSSSLKESVADAAYTSIIRMYNFQVTATDIQTVYKDVSVSLKTNEDIKAVFEKNFRETLGAGTYTTPLMSLNTAINSVNVKPDEGIAYVDFTGQFVSEMNAGTTKETGVLRSVANTLGYYYGVNKVIITLDGAQYSSGHIFMEPGEYFPTNYDGEKKVTGAP